MKKYLAMGDFRNLSFDEQKKHYLEKLANSNDFAIWEKALVQAVEASDIAPIKAYPLLHGFFNKIVVDKSNLFPETTESFLVSKGLAKSHAKFFKEVPVDEFLANAPLFEGHWIQGTLSEATVKAITKVLTIINSENE